jgi:hypothetical protein
MKRIWRQPIGRSFRESIQDGLTSVALEEWWRLNDECLRLDGERAAAIARADESYRRAIEDAAKVCEELVIDPDSPPHMDEAYHSQACVDCAAAIRALKANNDE